MKITFGCIIIYQEKILLVQEKNKKSKQLEKWNFPAGTAKNNEFIFTNAILREMREELELQIKIDGLVAVYESITPVDMTYFFVVGCRAYSEKIVVKDPNIVEAKFFLLEEFYKMPGEDIVHIDMQHVTKKYLDGVFIDTLRTVKYS